MINVIGLGYIGLPTSLMMASHGLEIIGTDYNNDLVKTLNEGKMTFKENGLEDLFSAALKNRIKFTSEYQTTDKYIISVPTPYNKSNKQIDPCYVVAAFKSVLNVCKENSIIVIESTVSPGTIDKFIRPLLNNTLKKISLVHCPERIIPGNMVYELIHNNRTIGADNPQIGLEVKRWYSTFCEGNIVITDIRTAEMTKVVENTYRAVNIAFANELTKICQKADMDVYEVIKICNMHPRVNILQPGPGVGGHCISVDPWFLVGDFPDLAKVIGESMKVNASMPDYLLDKVEKIVKEKSINSYEKVGIYGLTYKENVDDIRESPTLQLLERNILNVTDKIKIYDPWVKKTIVDNQFFDFDEFLSSVDIVVIMVKHEHLKNNMDKLKNKIILDACNICDFKGTYKL